MSKTLFEKIWDDHLVQDLGDGFGLIFVDRQLLTELATPQFDQLEKRGLPLRHPDCTFAISDHTVPTLRRRRAGDRAVPIAGPRAMREKSARYGFMHFDVDHPIAGHQQRHRAGNRAGAARHDVHRARQPFLHGAAHSAPLAWASCAGDVLHTLATQTSILKKPPTDADHD